MVKFSVYLNRHVFVMDICICPSGLFVSQRPVGKSNMFVLQFEPKHEKMSLMTYARSQAFRWACTFDRYSQGAYTIIKYCKIYQQRSLCLHQADGEGSQYANFHITSDPSSSPYEAPPNLNRDSRHFTNKVVKVCLDLNKWNTSFYGYVHHKNIPI